MIGCFDSYFPIYLRIDLRVTWRGIEITCSIWVQYFIYEIPFAEKSNNQISIRGQKQIIRPYVFANDVKIM